VTKPKGRDGEEENGHTANAFNSSPEKRTEQGPANRDLSEKNVIIWRRETEGCPCCIKPRRNWCTNIQGKGGNAKGVSSSDIVKSTCHTGGDDLVAKRGYAKKNGSSRREKDQARAGVIMVKIKKLITKGTIR